MATASTGWKCLATASITSETATAATITVKCYWQNVGWDYNISGVSAWVYCSDDSYKVKDSGAVNTTSAGTNGQVLMGSHSFTVNKGTAEKTIGCYAKITSNSSYVSGTKNSEKVVVKVPAKTSYAVTYNANGGTGAPSAQTKWHGTTLELSSVKPTRAGYTFKGWSTANDSTVEYNSGANYTANAKVTLYAVWQANTYTVSYNANGGTGAPASQTKTHDVNLTLSSSKPTRTNYKFKGWGTSESATTVSYASGATYSTNANVTLFAIWELDYIKPRITNLSASRCDSNGNLSEEGTNALVQFDWACDKDISSIYITCSDNANIVDYATVSATGKSGKVSKVIGSNKLSTDLSYEVSILVADSAGNTQEKIRISSIILAIDCLRGQRGVSFGKTAELEDTAEFEYKLKANKTATFEREIVSKEGHYVHRAIGLFTKAGYTKIARIKIGQSYPNAPIEFKIARRAMIPYTLTICFVNTDNTDPNVAMFTHSLNEGKAYLVKSATSTWDLFLQSGEYDDISVMDVMIPYYARDLDRLTITWTDEGVTSLPSGYKESVLAYCDSFQINSVTDLTNAFNSLPLYRTVNVWIVGTVFSQLTGEVANQAHGTMTKLTASVLELDVTSGIHRFVFRFNGSSVTEKHKIPKSAKADLWSGTWSSGNITVPNTDNFLLFCIFLKDKGTPILAIKNGTYIRGIGGFTTATPVAMTYQFAATANGNTWTMVACNSIDHNGSGSHSAITACSIEKIIGVI